MTNLTPARRRGLEALAANHPNPCRRTSIHIQPDPNRAGVYWQTADWLTGQGLAAEAPLDLAHRPVRDGVYLRLTPAGLERCAQLGIDVADAPAPPPPADPPPPAEARWRGHTLAWDPPHALSNVARWTCTNQACGAAVLSYQGNVYGQATETFCPCPTGCGCAGPEDADATECACDGPCTMGPTWVADRTTPDPSDPRGDDGPHSFEADSRMRRP
jgi:hypothetical protein